MIPQYARSRNVHQQAHRVTAASRRVYSYAHVTAVSCMQGMYEIRKYQLEAGYSTMGSVVDLLAKGYVLAYDACACV